MPSEVLQNCVRIDPIKRHASYFFENVRALFKALFHTKELCLVVEAREYGVE